MFFLSVSIWFVSVFLSLRVHVFFPSLSVLFVLVFHLHISLCPFLINFACLVCSSQRVHVFSYSSVFLILVFLSIRVIVIFPSLSVLHFWCIHLDVSTCFSIPYQFCLFWCFHFYLSWFFSIPYQFSLFGVFISTCPRVFPFLISFVFLGYSSRRVYKFFYSLSLLLVWRIHLEVSTRFSLPHQFCLFGVFFSTCRLVFHFLISFVCFGVFISTCPGFFHSLSVLLVWCIHLYRSTCFPLPH